MFYYLLAPPPPPLPLPPPHLYHSYSKFWLKNQLNKVLGKEQCNIQVISKPKIFKKNCPIVFRTE
jgi:hypothetical protein